MTRRAERISALTALATGLLSLFLYLKCNPDPQLTDAMPIKQYRDTIYLDSLGDTLYNTKTDSFREFRGVRFNFKKSEK